MEARNQIATYFARIGSDPMLIQGAGGNASWKEGSTMWIKASGTWLRDADSKDIFIPVDIGKTLELIANGETDLSSAQIGKSSMRPSIETCLHALLPQRYVLHIHAVDVIVLAVQKSGRDEFGQRLHGLDWVWVDYIKPGPDLANAVSRSISNTNIPNVLILGNHGLVVAANTLEELQSLLSKVLSLCTMPARTLPKAQKHSLEELEDNWRALGYELPGDERCHALALDPICLKLAESAWVLYPDHAVFLGACASIVKLPPLLKEEKIGPPCYIIPDRGVVVRQDLSPGQLAMLTCYSEVALRLSSIDLASPLSCDQILDLLNWDAEKYRQSINAT